MSGGINIKFVSNMNSGSVTVQNMVLTKAEKGKARKPVNKAVTCGAESTIGCDVDIPACDEAKDFDTDQKYVEVISTSPQKAYYIFTKNSIVRMTETKTFNVNAPAVPGFSSGSSGDRLITLSVLGELELGNYD